jgi:hypothetical protein
MNSSNAAFLEPLDTTDRRHDLLGLGDVLIAASAWGIGVMAPMPSKWYFPGATGSSTRSYREIVHQDRQDRARRTAVSILR